MKPKKSLGQYWLYDSDALESIVEAAEVDSDDHILEIGPGLGTLTEVLLATGTHVIAVEYDKDLFDQLRSEASQFYSQDSERLTLVNQDILQFDLTKLPAGYKIVANIPYYLTSNLVKTISESSNPPAVAVLLIQKEVAERATAGPGGMSLLSVATQFYWQTGLGQVVPAKLFTPPPKVDSQVLVLKWRKTPLFPGIDGKQFFRIVKAGFAGRRKTLLNSLSGGLRRGKDEISASLESAGINPQSRAQELSLQDWYKLYQHLAD